MNQIINRRNFILHSTKAGIAGCILFCCPKSFAAFINSNEIPDPKKLNYCGYQCPENCELLKATLGNDLEAKKTVYENWKIKEQYGFDFDPEKIFCYTCKAINKPEGIIVANCKVKECVISKGLECCIECDDLINCKKELWDKHPEFKVMVIEMQKTYKNNLK